MCTACYIKEISIAKGKGAKTGMKKVFLLAVVFLLVLTGLVGCNDPQSPAVSLGLEELSSLEEISYPHLVCKEGQWYLETGIRQEDLSGASHWSPNYAVQFESYSDFCSRIKMVDFTQEQIGEMGALVKYYYPYEENGGLAIPDPALLEKCSFPFAPGKVMWGLNQGICIYPDVRGAGPGKGEYLIIHEKKNYSKFFQLISESYLETLETTVIGGRMVYQDSSGQLISVSDFEDATVYIQWYPTGLNRTNMSQVRIIVEEQNGLVFTYLPNGDSNYNNVTPSIASISDFEQIRLTKN